MALCGGPYAPKSAYRVCGQRIVAEYSECVLLTNAIEKKILEKDDG